MKYDKEVTIQKAVQLIQDKGLTNEQLFKALNVSKTQFYEWTKKYADFSNAIKEARERSIDVIENKLYKEAAGYFITETKKTVIQKANGTKDLKVEEIVKYIRPSLGAIVYITKNRRPDRWADNKFNDEGSLPKEVEEKNANIVNALDTIERIARDSLPGDDPK